MLGSAALHGAVATLIIWRLATEVGAPTPVNSRMVVMNVHLVASAAPPAGLDAAPASPRRAIMKTADQSTPQPARLAASAAPAQTAAGSAPAGVSSSGPASPEVEGQARTDYESVLLAHLRNYFFYPDQARERRLRGAVEVRLSLARDGQVLGAWVQTSSGEAVLDDAALELVRRAQPMPAIPRALPDQMDVYLPLEYLPPKIVIGAG
jgi:protein TonB